MTLEQLQKFCAPVSSRPQFAWMSKPFAIDGWRVATDGYILVAENGVSAIKLPQLEASLNKDYILKMLAEEIPQTKYSNEHLLGYLSDQGNFDSEELTGMPEEPILFGSCGIDKNKLKKVFVLCGEPYSYTLGYPSGNGFHFKFGKTIAVIMGMLNVSPAHPRYEPLKARS